MLFVPPSMPFMDPVPEAEASGDGVLCHVDISWTPNPTAGQTVTFTGKLVEEVNSTCSSSNPPLAGKEISAHITAGADGQGSSWDSGLAVTNSAGVWTKTFTIGDGSGQSGNSVAIGPWIMNIFFGGDSTHANRSSHDQTGSFIAFTVAAAPDTTPPVVTVRWSDGGTWPYNDAQPVPDIISFHVFNSSGVLLTFITTASDDIGVTSGPTCPHYADYLFPVGTTTVTCTASDAAGNVGTASFTVTVVLEADTTPPVLIIHAAHSDGLSMSTFPTSLIDYGNGSVSYGVEVVGEQLTPTCNPSNGPQPYTGSMGGFNAASSLWLFIHAISSVPSGASIIICTATDAAGNIGSATLTVEVPDTTPPEHIALEQFMDDFITATAYVNSTSPTGRTLTVINDRISSDQFGTLGSGDIGLNFKIKKGGTTVYDHHGVYRAAYWSQGVTWNTHSWSIPIPDGTYYEGLGFPSTGLYTNWTAGTYTIIWDWATPSWQPTFSGSDSSTFTVPAPPAGADTTPPVVTVPSNQNLIATPPPSSQSSTLHLALFDWNPTATDDVGVTYFECLDWSIEDGWWGWQMNTIVTDGTFTPYYSINFPVGTNTVTCIAKDAAGNEGTASFTVTVTQESAGDTTPPVINFGGCIEQSEYVDNVYCWGFNENDVLTRTALNSTGYSLRWHVNVYDAGDTTVNTPTCYVNLLPVMPIHGMNAINPHTSINHLVPPPTQYGAYEYNHLFPIHPNTVLCQLVDDAGNLTEASFVVTVLEPPGGSDTTPPSREAVTEPMTLSVGGGAVFIDVDNNGNIVVKLDNGVVKKYDTNNNLEFTFFSWGNGMVVDSSGNIFVGQNEPYDKITKYNYLGNSVVWNYGLPSTPHRMAIDSNNNLYVTSGGSTERLIKVTSSGSVSTLKTWSGSDPDLKGIGVDSSGNIYVGQRNPNLNNQCCLVMKYSSSGSVIGSVGNSGTGSMHERPLGTFGVIQDVAFDSSGNIYVSDSYINRITVFDSSGNLIRWFTVGSPSISGNGVYGVDIDGVGNIYTAERGDNRVQIFPPNYSEPSSGDTTPPTFSNFPPTYSNSWPQYWYASNSTGYNITFNPYSVSDDVGVTSGPTCSPSSGSLFPVGTTTVTCTASDAAGNVGTVSFTVTVVLEADTTPPEEEIVIPDWIKSNAGWWDAGLIDDRNYVTGLQWLISNGIMTIPPTEQGTGSDDVIPSWVKNNARWWADGSIDDRNYVTGLQWLITNGVMTIG